MQNDRFEWDDNKALANLAKHKVSFGMGCKVFDDDLSVEMDDEQFHDGEDRWLRVGMVAGRLIAVAYTLRGEIIRVISVRGATPRKKRQYHEVEDEE
jgi:uncharacterized protein